MYTPPKETPTDGCNQAVGVITHNTGGIVGDAPIPVNISGTEYVHALAERRKDKLLAQFLTFTKTYAPNVLWEKRMKLDGVNHDVRIELPGIVRAYDRHTGEMKLEVPIEQLTTLQKQ